MNNRNPLEQEAPEKLRLCDIFIVLLSKEYHLADFTDHHLGVAYCLKKPIIPLSIDGTIPYGFMSKYQSVNGTEGITAEVVENLAYTIYLRLGNGSDIIDSMIAVFADSGSFDEANKRARMLFEYEEFFNRSQFNLIARAFMKNDQIRAGYRSKSLVLELLRERKTALTSDLIEKLKSLSLEGPLS